MSSEPKEMGKWEEVNGLRTSKDERPRGPKKPEEEEDGYRPSEVKRAFIVQWPRYSGRGTQGYVEPSRGEGEEMRGRLWPTSGQHP